MVLTSKNWGKKIRTLGCVIIFKKTQLLLTDIWTINIGAAQIAK